MSRVMAVIVAVLLVATPAAAEQIACVSSEQHMIEASAKHGEALQWSGLSHYQQPFWFFASFAQQTYTVWFQLADGRICTGPGYVGNIQQMGSNPA
jgi:hypothetical protein